MGRAKERYMESAQRAFGPAAQQSAGNVFNIAGEQRQQSREEDINKDIFKSLLNTPAYTENENIASVVNQGIKSGMIPGSYGIRLLQQHDQNQLQRDSMDQKRMQDQVSNAMSQQSSERAQQAAMAAQRKAQLGESNAWLDSLNRMESASVRRASGLASGADVSLDSYMSEEGKGKALDIYNQRDVQHKMITSMAANQARVKLNQGELPEDYNLLVGDISKGDARSALGRFDGRDKQTYIDLLREKGQADGKPYWDDNAGDFTPRGREMFINMLREEHIDSFMESARSEFQGMSGEHYIDYRNKPDPSGAAKELEGDASKITNEGRHENMPDKETLTERMIREQQENGGLSRNASQNESLQRSITTLMGPPDIGMTNQGQPQRRVPQERQARVFGQPYAYRRY